MKAIVIGLGGMGAAAAYQLAARGVDVLGFEQFYSGHQQGSSHGHTRIIRTAYYEHPDYIPLVRQSFAGWRRLEMASGQRLLLPCDCLSLGLAEGKLLRGLDAAAARLASGAVESLSAEQVQARYPFRLPPNYAARLEHEAGILLVEACVRAHGRAAQAAGADLREGEAVLAWRSFAHTVQVRTAAGNYEADVLVITAGPWAASLVGNLGVPLSVMRQTMHWFQAADSTAAAPNRFPIFLCETSAGDFYGLPAIDGRGAKIARHYGAAEVHTPDMVDRTIHPEDEAAVRSFLERFLPGMFGKQEQAQVCLYTLTPDRHFVIDRHPEHSNVVVAAGFSGHGFKFAPVVGELLADLACGVQERGPSMFQAGRCFEANNHASSC